MAVQVLWPSLLDFILELLLALADGLAQMSACKLMCRDIPSFPRVCGEAYIVFASEGISALFRTAWDSIVFLSRRNQQ